MRNLRSLRHCRRGISALEFGLIAPVMLLLVCGTLELGHMMMSRTVLEGAVTEAARLAVATQETSETGREQVMRASIAAAMKNFPLATNQSLTITTTVYADFSTAYPEDYSDANGNGKYDLGEVYVDRNRNGVWDNATPIPGTMGGPGDVVSFTVRYPKKMLFDFILPLIGASRDRTVLSATTVVRNEAVVRKS